MMTLSMRGKIIAWFRRWLADQPGYGQAHIPGGCWSLEVSTLLNIAYIRIERSTL